MYAERKGWQLETIHVDLELHKDDESDTGRIARVVSFLASSDGAWVNGQVLRANGGII